jgi:hypothetical protein
VSTIDWRTGYIGTPEWTADERRRRDERTARRIETARASGMALADDTAGFGGCFAPSGTGETVDSQRTVDGTLYPAAPAHRRETRYILGAFLTARMRDERRQAMRTARDIETARRIRLNAAQTAQTDGPVLTDETAYVSPVSDEWRGVDVRTLLALSETGWRAAGDILTAYETAYAARRAHTAGIETAMQTEPDRDGRGTYVDPRQRWGVNATETRHTARWHGTPRHAVRDRDGRPVDMTCYRLIPPASGIGPWHRVPFAPVRDVETDETARTSTTRAVAVDTAGEYSIRLARFGAVGSGETD